MKSCIIKLSQIWLIFITAHGPRAVWKIWFLPRSCLLWWIELPKYPRDVDLHKWRVGWTEVSGLHVICFSWLFVLSLELTKWALDCCTEAVCFSLSSCPTVGVGPRPPSPERWPFSWIETNLYSGTEQLPGHDNHCQINNDIEGSLVVFVFPWVVIPLS